MRIESGAVYSRYQAYGKGNNKVEIPTQIAKDGQPVNADVVSISGAAARESGTTRMAQNITAEVEVNGSAAHLQALRERVQSKEYHVPSQELAGAILGLRG